MAAGQAVRLIEVSVGSVTFHLGNGALVLSILGIKLDDPCKKLTWYRARIWYSLSVHGYYVLLSLLPTSDIQSRPPGCPGLLGSAGTMPLRLMRACPPPSPAVISMYSLGSRRESQEALALESCGHSQPKPNTSPEHQLQTCVPVTSGDALVPCRQHVSARPVILQAAHPGGWLSPVGPQVCWAELGSSSWHFVVERSG